MLKKISVLALAGLLALPAMASAGAGGAASSLDAQIADLTKQLEALKAQMKEMKEAQKKAPADDGLRDKLEALEERAESWDLASRIQLSGDFRSRLDGVTADTPSHYTALDIGLGFVEALSAGGTNYSGITPAAIQGLATTMKGFTAAQRKFFFDTGFAGAGLLTAHPPEAAQEFDNDTIWTNRFRLNLRAKATENVEFKGRLAMYKAWGMQNNPNDYSYNNGMGGGPFMTAAMFSGIDGGSTRQPDDNILRVDRAYVNWNNIGGMPVWFSIGRRPTSDGPPAHLKQGLDERQATPAAVMDYPFDGLTVGYAYNSLAGLTDAPGRIRFCYGRGFEAGPDSDQNKYINDVDFAGLAWDVYQKGDRFLYLQSYGAFNIFNVPDGATFGNPIEYQAWDQSQKAGLAAANSFFYDPLDPTHDLVLNRANLGNIYHTSGVYMDKHENLNYFLAASWSRTDAQGMDEMGTSLLGSWWDNPTNKDGYLFHVGGRYDIPSMPLKVGAEFNHGTQNWIGFTPGHDDMFQSKLATRGQVYEVYGIWDIPGGEAVSKFGKAFMRLGYQHYEYDYTGSGFWLGEPRDIDELATDPLNAQFYTPIKDMDQVYVTFEAYF